jgi:ribosomal protein S18 acetylase RimI-like enzyme
MIAIAEARSAAEIELARTLFEEYAASLTVDLRFQDFAAELAGLPGAYVAPQGALLLAREEHQCLGCVALRPLQAPAVAELKRLYVRPAARGRGVGLMLTEAALRRAREAGYRRVRLDTLPEMRQAQALYRQLGFGEIAPYRYNPMPGTLYMELRFDD